MTKRIRAASAIVALVIVVFLPRPCPAEDSAIDLLTDSPQQAGWALGIGQEFPGAKGELTFRDEPQRGMVMKLVGDFSGGGQYVQTGRKLDLNLDELSMWVKAPNHDQVTVRLIDGDGTCHQLRLRVQRGDDWQPVRLPLKAYFQNIGTTQGRATVLQHERWGGEQKDGWSDPCRGLFILTGRGQADPSSRKAVLEVAMVRAVAGSGPTEPKAEATPAATVTRTISLDSWLDAGENPYKLNLGWEFKGAKGAMDVVEPEGDMKRRSVKLSGDFTGGGAYVGLELELKRIEHLPLAALRFKLKASDLNGWTVRLSDATGQAHQRKNWPITADGKWHEVTLDPHQIAGGEHWGGAKDGRWHGGIRHLAIAIASRNATNDKKGWLQVADIVADVAAEAEAGKPAFEEGFESKSRFSTDWQTEGDVRQVAEGARTGKAALLLHRTEANYNQVTRAVGPTVSLTGSWWNASAAGAVDLHSPDASFCGEVVLEWLDDAGKVVGRDEVLSIFGKRDWDAATRTLERRDRAVAGRFVATLHKAHGSFRIDDLALRPVSAGDVPLRLFDKVEMSTAQLGNLLFPTDPVKVKLEAHAFDPLTDEQLQMQFNARDFWQAEVGPWQRVTMSRAGRDTKTGRFLYTAELDLTPLNLTVGRYYEVHARLGGVASEVFEDYVGLARLPEAITRRYPPHDVPFTSRNWDNRIKEYFFLSDRLGLRSIGLWCHWEPFPPFAPKAPGIEWAQQLGMICIGSTPSKRIEKKQGKWEQYTDEAMAQGTRNLIRTFKSQGLYGIVMGNEPPERQEDADRNTKMYEVMYDAAKAEDPDILMIGTSVGPTETYFKAGFHRYLDVVDFHTYQGAETVERSFARYDELFKKYGHPKPIWSTELGLNSQGMRRDTVAVELYKKSALFFAGGGEVMSWFTILYPDPTGTSRGSAGDSHNTFDCRYRLYNPRLDAIAYYNVVNGVCIKKFVEQRSYSGDIRAFLFRDKDQQAMQILWCNGPAKDVFIPIAGLGADQAVKVTYLDGSSSELATAGEGVTLTIGGYPVMLQYGPSSGGLAAQLGEPRIALVEGSELTVIKGASSRWSLRGPDAVKDQIEVTAPFGWQVAVTGGEAGMVTGTLGVPEDTGAWAGQIRIGVRAQAGRPGAELVYQLPVTQRLAAELTPTLVDSQPAVQMRITNQGKTAQRVSWRMELVGELKQAEGRYNLGAMEPAGATFTAATMGDGSVAPGQSLVSVLPLASVTPTSIYRVKLVVTGEDGRQVTRQRLLAGWLGVKAVSSAPTIDGKLDEPAWKQAMVGMIDQPVQYYRLQKAEGNRTGPDDCSAKIRFLWDAQYLYASAEVQDDVDAAGHEGSGKLWNQDGLQCYVDPYRSQAGSTGAYDYAMGIGTDGPAAWCHQSGDSMVSGGLVPEIRVAVHRQGTITTYEVAIPWSRLAPFKPAAGANLGIGFGVNEDDGPGREGLISWFSGIHGKEADMVGDLILLPE